MPQTSFGIAKPLGVGVSSELGTPVEAGAARFTLTGVGATGLLGAVQATARALAQFFGVAVTPAVGTTTVTGAGRVVVTGVQATATASYLPPVEVPPAVADSYGSGPARRYRDPKPKPERHNVPGRAMPLGVGATAKCAPQVKARGASAAVPVCIPPTQAVIGQVQADGYHNLTNEEWLLLIEAAA